MTTAMSTGWSIRMTLDEAIEHLEDTIKNKEFSCESCKEDHKQLLIWLKELRAIKSNQEKTMTVREYIEQNKEKFLGYIVRVWDRDDYELFAFRMKKETNLDNMDDSLVQQLLDDELINIDIYDRDDDEPQVILTSNCEL